MSKQLTQAQENLVEQAKRTIKARGGKVTRIKVTDTKACGSTWREINLMGTSARSPQETIQGKVLPDAYQDKHKMEIYTGR